MSRWLKLSEQSSARLHSADQAPTGPEEVDAGDIIRVNTTLVTIPVSVMDRDGRYVPNLRKEDFRLWEDGVEQEVAFFSSVDKPFSVVLMLDTSPSTQFRLEDIQDAAISFVNQLRADDRVMVVSFNDDIKMLSDFTTDRSRLDRAIRRAHTDDGTRLYDAVDTVINRELNRIPGRKAIVLFTDGVDTTSRQASFESNLTDAQELDALIYPVQYDTSADVNAGGGATIQVRTQRTSLHKFSTIFLEVAATLIGEVTVGIVVVGVAAIRLTDEEDGQMTTKQRRSTFGN